MRNTIGFLLLALCAACYPAFATTNDDDRNTWSAAQDLGALDNCGNAAINAAVTCGGTRGFRVEGYQWLTLDIAYTKDAGTGYTFTVQACNEGQTTSDCTNAADWATIAAESVAGGVTSLSLGSFAHVASASDHLVDTIGVNYRRIRLASFVATGSPTANDKITVNGLLTVNNGF
jgi:hypothetical protein